MVFILALMAGCIAHPAFTVKPVLTHVVVSRQNGRYDERARLTFALVQAGHSGLPVADPGLRAHMAGHAVVARRVAASSGGGVQSSGSSKQQADLRMKRTIARLTVDLQAELVREEKAYDAVTEDGAAQRQGPAFGFPGGPNARVPCPRSQ